MKTSIIIPLYRGKKYVKGLLDNICRCCRKSDGKMYVEEVIFVNDAPDEAIDQRGMSEYDFPVYIIQNEQNRGIHFSRVRGLGQAKGDYILFLDQDDSIDDSYFLSQMRRISDNDVIICNGKYRGDKQIIHSQTVVDIIKKEEPYFATLGEIISPGQALIKRTSIPAAWKENILQGNYCDDAFLWMLMKDAGRKFDVNMDILYYHREGAANRSFQWGDNAWALQELYDVIKGKKLLKDGNFEKFSICVEDKIRKQKQYAVLEEKLPVFFMADNLRHFFLKNNIKKVSVYGYGVFGKRIWKKIEESGVEMVAFIDRNAEAFRTDEKPVWGLQDDFGTLDMIIVTALFDYENIEKALQYKTKARIISLETLCDVMERENE